MARKLNATTAADAAAAPRNGKPKKGKTDASRIVSNVTDETIVAAVMECGGFKAEVETANGRYRNALKKWEDRGVDAGTIARVLAIKKREVHDVEGEFRRLNRFLRVLKIPIGAQLGLFEDGESIAAKVDGDEIAGKAKIDALAQGDDIAAAQAKGYDCGLRDYGADVNPHGDGDPLALAWEAGRKQGLEQRRLAGAEVTA
jgi:hypothetical protein